MSHTIEPTRNRYAVLCAAMSIAAWALIGGLLFAANDTVDLFLPSEALNLKLAAPIDTWDEAIPLGNGLMGGLLWGKDQTVRLSLDRGDLWNLRLQDEFKKKDWTWKTVQRLVAEKKQAELVSRFETPFFAPWPTKLPAGRLELSLAHPQHAASFTLDLARAVGRVKLDNGLQLETFFSAAEPVALMRIPGPLLKKWKLIAPTSVKVLGYPQAEFHEDGNTKWFIQETATEFRYAVIASTRREGGMTMLAVTITTSDDGPDPVELGRKRLANALDDGYANMLARHETWWREFWHKSRVELPELHHLRQYYLTQYFYGAASRLGAPPMPLQGVWTADADALPPWKGEYANNLNTQMCYAAYQTAGRFEEGRCFLEFMWKLLPKFRTFATNFYGTPGAAVPTAMALDGSPLGGWATVAVNPTNSAWIGYLFYQHWRYTMDEVFLRERTYPWCAEVGQCLLGLLKPDAKGTLKLALSTSPEIHDNKLKAWLNPNSNYDHDCMASLFSALAEMADVLGKRDDAAKWRKALSGLGNRAVDPKTNWLMIAPGENLNASHRHMSHVMSIHPFGLLTIDGSEQDRAVIDATRKRLEELGTSQWCGYSFGWWSCICSRAGDAEAAIKYLDIFNRAFILRNGFHANGDQSKAGYSDFTYRPFTLEGNFLAAQAVHEMLLQSWGNIVRVFPAMPERWRQAAFDDLRTEGGYRVSARRENGITARLKVVASRNGVLKIRDNFGSHTPVWNRPDMKKVGNDWQCFLKAGESVEASFPSKSVSAGTSPEPPQKSEEPDI